ncbi:MAG TPA: ATP-dependent DNA helicase, partial [Alphaproteobacteria bacterium]|nr:ATP-dependent DNA helicase [Alphaproteobacteria bacterium]
MSLSVADVDAFAPRTRALAVGLSRAVFVSEDGEIEEMTLEDAAAYLRALEPPLLCHGPALARRLDLPLFPAFDLLELFAFARPAQFTVPTPKGLAQALGLAEPRGLEGEALALHDAARALLNELAAPGIRHGAEAVAIAQAMSRGGWLWGASVEAALRLAGARGAAARKGSALAVWTRLNEWSDEAPPPPPGNLAVFPAETLERLARLLGEGAESRPQQKAFAQAAARAFAAPNEAEQPRVVVAEAGTGVGKTLGYIAPASLWSEKNEGPVWLSTYTRNLQRQIDRELDRLYPDPREKAERAVLRKGRENYLCLLNFEDAANRAALLPTERVALGLMARWAEASRDGDMVGGDFPAWLVSLLGARRTLELTDKRGECIYSACPHYRRCFIEKSQRLARRAQLVIANHALVMAQAALAAEDLSDDRALPSRYVFDEGHHLFDAADSTFSALLSGAEAHELRRWLLGPERTAARGAGSRARGLANRVADLVEGSDALARALEETLKAARALPALGWHERLAADAPQGPAERFLALVRTQVLARGRDVRGPYSIETETLPPVPGLPEAAQALDGALGALSRPMVALAL